MKENIDRFSYVNNLILAKDTPVVKIITGIRRCGKSTIMLLFLQELKKLGVKDENIIYISFESLKNQYIQNHIDLYNRICKLRKNTNEHFYLLLDELQNVESQQKAISSFLTDFDIDIYIIGSNSKLLSSEFATHIAGRYIQIKMNPLNFFEYIKFKKEYDSTSTNKTERELFFEYVKEGGLPAIHFMNQNNELKNQYLTDVFNSIL